MLTSQIATKCKTLPFPCKLLRLWLALNFLLAFAVFTTATKDSSTITFDTLKQICAAVDIPVVAIGGITAENAQPCIQAGCHGVAVVSAIFAAEDAAAAAQQIRKAVDSVLSNN